MRDEQKSKGKSLTDSAELRRRVSELEAALKQAEEDRAQTLSLFTDLETLEALEHESRLFAESIVQTVREPLLVLDEGLRVKTANRSFYESFQVAAEDTEGRLLFELGDGQWDIPPLRVLLDDVLLKNAQFEDFEVEHDFPTIGPRTMLLNARQIRWNGSKASLILLAVEDVTERKRTEARVAFQASLLDQVRNAVITTDLEGKITFWNKHAETLYGWKAEEVIGKEITEVTVPPSSTDLAGEIMQTVREHGQWEGEFEVRKRNGDTFPAFVVLGTVKGPHGELAGLVGVNTDITERKRVEQRLQQAVIANEQMALASLREREFADAIISSMAEGVIVYGGQGEVIRMNAAAREMLGLSEGENGLSLAEVETFILREAPEGEPVGLEDTAAARALRGEKVLGHESVIRRPDGKLIWVSTSAAPINSPNGEPWGAVVAFADITALHEMQEEREDILRAVSHDLRNPLTAVQGQAQIMIRLLKNAGDGGRIEESAENIFTSARRMDGMIQDLTDSLLLESGELQLRRQPVHLQSLVSGLLARTAGAMEMERVKLEIPDDLPQFEADPERLERILTNLVSNALKYSPTESEVLIRAEAGDGEVRVSVLDRGRGIAPEDLPHIFERFHRTKGGRRDGGLGLGLSITRKLVEAHGGRILVESEVNEGTTFTFTLPLEG